MKRPWSTEKLGTVADLRAGYGFPKDLQGRRTGDIPFAKVRDVSAAARSGGELKGADNWIVEEDLERLRAKTVPSGTTLFPKIGEAIRSNNRAFARCELIVDNNVMGAVPRLGKVEPRFLYWWLRKTDLAPLASATTVPSIRKSTLAELDVPVPALDEQRRIVSKIESLFARSRRAKEALDAIPPLLDRLRQSILAAAFRGDLTADWRAQNPDVEPADKLLERIRTERRRRWEEAQLAKMRAKGKEPKNDKWKANYKEPEGCSRDTQIPSTWCWAAIAEVADVGTGATPKRGTSEFWDGATIPWVTSGALNSSEVTRSNEFVTEAALQRTNLRLYPPGTLLVAMYGEGRTRGKCSELRFEATTNQAIAAIVGGEESRSFMKTLKRFLQSRYQETRAAGAGGVQPNLNLSVIRGIRFPLLPEEEANVLQTRIENLLLRVGALESALARAADTYATLDTSILGEAFKGQLVAQAPSSSGSSAPPPEGRSEARSPT